MIRPGTQPVKGACREWRLYALLCLGLPFLWNCHATNFQSLKARADQKGTTKGFRPYPARASMPVKRSHKPRRIALLIGINQYKDRSWHPLRFAAKDAKDMAKVLQSNTLGKFDRVLLRTTAAQTTRKAIIDAFDEVKRWARSPQDTVFVYISAHGSLARNSLHQLRRYLVTHDTLSRKVSATGLGVESLRRRFASFPSQRKVMLLATCHSGAGKSRLSRVMRAELKTLKGSFFVKPMERVSRATFILGVCSFGETAQESPLLKNDIYTHYFIKAIRNRYDANGDGAVTLTEAHDYAKELTYYHTKGQQRPYAESDILGADPIVLVGAKRRLGKPVLYAYDARFNGVHVHVNGTPKGSFPRGITMKAGRQKVKLLSHDKKAILFNGEVELRAGERMDVQKLFRRQHFPFALAFKSGYQGFLLDSTGDRLSRGLPLFGVEFKFHRPFSIPFDLRLEFAFAHSSHTLPEKENLPQTVTELNFAVAITYHWKWRWLTLYVGPRVSAIYLHRQSDLYKDLSDFFYSFQPGLLAGAEWRVFQQWSLFVEGRLNYTYVTVENGPAQHQGSYECLGGAYFHF